MNVQLFEKNFKLIRNGMTLCGVEVRPNATGTPLPAVILSHGLFSCYEATIGYARALAECGYAAFCFDFIGGGTEIRSDGTLILMQMTVLTEKADLLAVMDYVRTLPYIDTEKLSLLGCSQGGFVSALAAAERNLQVHKLVLFFPALCIPDDVRRGKMLMFQFNPTQIPECISAGDVSLSGDYARAVINLDAYEEIKAFSGNVLILHGTKDDCVPLHYSEKAKDVYGKQCQLCVIDGAEHGFDGDADAYAITLIKEFLA